MFPIPVGVIARAQPIERFNSFSYNVNEGLLQSTITDIAFDKNNFCWLSFPNGIQKFDGKNFTNVPAQQALPDDKGVYFFRNNKGDFFISHSQGISKYEMGGNRFIQLYTIRTGEQTPAQFIGEDENTIYFYTVQGTITGIDCLTYKVVTETKMGLPDYSSHSDYRPTISNNIIDHKVALQIKSSLYLWDLKKRKLISRSAPIRFVSDFFLRLKTGDEVLYYNYKLNNALQVYNFATNTTHTQNVKGKDDKIISRCIILPWQNKTLISFSNRLYETDTALHTLKSELVNFQNQPIAGASGIARIKEDNFGNLIIVTVTGGIRKVIRNNYPIKYYGSGKEENNFVMSILPDKKNNRILAGIGDKGLLVFDTLQRLIKHIKTLPGRSLSFSPNNIIKTGKDRYLLFISGENNVWSLSNNFSEIKRIRVSTSLPENKSGIAYFGNFLFQNQQEAVIQSQSKLYKTSFAANTITEHEFTASYTMSGLHYNTMILSHTNDELIFLNAGNFTELKRIPFKNTGGVRCFAKDTVDNIYIGSNKGIFKINAAGTILQHLNKENGLPDECIYAMVFDDEGFLWCSTNKGILRVNQDNSILQLKKEDGLQENEFNTNVVAKAEDGEIFFGGVNGISSFYPSAISNVKDKINLLFTGIKINNKEAFTDTAVWDIKKIDLPYHQNSLSFDFIAMANSNPGQYIYQYKMKGIDEQWIQNNELQTVRYFLPAGEYVFQIYASRFFDKDAEPMKEMSITIHPPFWKTGWFLTGIIALSIALLAYAINKYYRINYKKKLLELENEHRIQLERERISRDLHDNIGAYANAVLYNTELLEKQEGAKQKEDLMKGLKYASKDIITSLRATIWALKKDNYSAEECLLRIRNFVQPFTNYYPDINFKVQGEASAQKQLHYTKALNVVRIVQEAITNAIKHSSARNIKVESNEMDGNWQLTISDDGTGFNEDSITGTEQGSGLNNMKKRAIDSHLELAFTSQPGKGTRINILIKI